MICHQLPVLPTNTPCLFGESCSMLLVPALRSRRLRWPAVQGTKTGQEGVRVSSGPPPWRRHASLVESIFEQRSSRHLSCARCHLLGKLGKIGGFQGSASFNGALVNEAAYQCMHRRRHLHRGWHGAGMIVVQRRGCRFNVSLCLVIRVDGFGTNRPAVQLLVLDHIHLWKREHTRVLPIFWVGMKKKSPNVMYAKCCNLMALLVSASAFRCSLCLPRSSVAAP